MEEGGRERSREDSSGVMNGGDPFDDDAKLARVTVVKMQYLTRKCSIAISVMSARYSNEQKSGKKILPLICLFSVFFHFFCSAHRG